MSDGAGGVAWAQPARTPFLEAASSGSKYRSLLRKVRALWLTCVSQLATAGGLTSSPFSPLPAWTPGLWEPEIMAASRAGACTQGSPEGRVPGASQGTGRPLGAEGASHAHQLKRWPGALSVLQCWL